MATETSIVGHSSFHFEDLQLSSQEFYQSVEESIKSYQYPNINLSRIKFKEGGMFSANREYLCVKRKEYMFYICASPFGRSFFVSWWLKEQGSLFHILMERVPFIGARIARNMQKKTFYQIDTEQLFKESIKRVVDGVMDEIAKTKGIRSPNSIMELTN